MQFETFMQNSTIEEKAIGDPEITELGAASKPSTATQQYQPTLPKKQARRLSILRQALHLPRTLLRICRIIREDFSTAALDENVWAFWGFHQEVFDHQPWDPHYRARRWQKAQLGAIGPQHVVGGLAVWEMAFMMNVAMENEDPIMEYSRQSGEGFRFLLPTMGRFMGKNEEQSRLAAERGLPWCEAAWCAEERRHSNTFARLIERLMNASPDRRNPNQPMVVTTDEAAAVRHIINRQATEWNASSSYAVFAAHASGDLHILLRNIVRDEIKHLSILSAADSYLFGPRRFGCFPDLVKLGIENYSRQKKKRSGGDLLGSNPVLAIEGIVAHLLTAFYVIRWLRTVPLRTLAVVFETPSKLPELPAFTPPQAQMEADETLQSGKEKRLGLLRWKREQRSQALARRCFEEANGETVGKIIASELDGFLGAETPGSRGDRRIRNHIADLGLEHCGLETHGKKMLRACLLDRLRHYQIKNNRHVLARMAAEKSILRSARTHNRQEAAVLTS